MVDPRRSKEKGYETLVKEGLCDEVGYNTSYLFRTTIKRLIKYLFASVR